MSNYHNSGYGNSCSSGCGQNRSTDCNSCPVRSVNYNASGSGCGCSRLVCGVCSLKAIGLFGVLLALAVGIILGAAYAETFFPALSAIIVFAVIMAVAVIALLIYRRCEC